MIRKLGFEARAKFWIRQRTRSIESLEVARARLLGYLADKENKLLSQDINRALCVLEFERSKTLGLMTVSHNGN